MSRYQNSKIKKTNNIDHYSTTYYAKTPVRDDDMYFIATQGDRCDLLAVRFYGDVNLWWFIAKVNNIKTMNIPAGTPLRIPSNVSTNGY